MTVDEMPPLTSDPREPVDRLLRDLRTRSEGLTNREAVRRLEVHGPNELSRRVHRTWPKQLLKQFTYPLALLLWLAAALAAVSRRPGLGGRAAPRWRRRG